MSKVVPVRDPEVTARILEGWFRDTLPAHAATVTDLSVPKAGFSNETIFGRVDWTPLPQPTEAAREQTMQFVLRIQPTGHQLYQAPDALRQARTMDALSGRVPVPRVLMCEPDPAVLGAPFFMMERIEGRIPGDVPSFHERGWVAELSRAERQRLHDNALRQLARLHAVDVSPGELDFLSPEGTGPPVARVVEQLTNFHEWCGPVLRYDVDVIDTALQFLLDEQPACPRTSIVWGDARVGNIIFSPDLDVAAMVDWEAASIGPPEVDVAWWTMFDEYLCEANGLRRLAGIPNRTETYARYEEIAATELHDIRYFEVLAGTQFALINSRMADLLIRTGATSEEFASELVTRGTTMTKRALDRSE